MTLDSILTGKSVAFTTHKSIGCPCERRGQRGEPGGIRTRRSTIVHQAGKIGPGKSHLDFDPFARTSEFHGTHPGIVSPSSRRAQESENKEKIFAQPFHRKESGAGDCRQPHKV